MERIFVSIGSNVDRERRIEQALAMLRARFGELQLSSVYESEAVGFDGAPFLNLVAAFDSDAEPEDIVDALREIEDRCGRERSAARFGPRTMDIDLLLVGNRVIDDGELVIPRDEVESQAFVLCPLAEIAPEREHPVSGETIGSLWARLEDETGALRRVALRHESGAEG